MHEIKISIDRLITMAVLGDIEEKVGRKIKRIDLYYESCDRRGDLGGGVKITLSDGIMDCSTEVEEMIHDNLTDIIFSNLRNIHFAESLSLDEKFSFCFSDIVRKSKIVLGINDQTDPREFNHDEVH